MSVLNLFVFYMDFLLQYYDIFEPLIFEQVAALEFWNFVLKNVENVHERKSNNTSKVFAPYVTAYCNRHRFRNMELLKLRVRYFSPETPKVEFCRVFDCRFEIGFT